MAVDLSRSLGPYGQSLVFLSRIDIHDAYYPSVRGVQKGRVAWASYARSTVCFSMGYRVVTSSH
jgi:hypothetical protein